MDQQFKDLVDKFIRMWATASPTEAFSEGMREYAGFLPNLSKSNVQAYLLFLQNIKNELATINIEQLTRNNQVDYLVLENKIDSIKFDVINLKSLETNPLAYVGAAFIYDYLLKDYAPLIQRTEELIVHLNQLPNYYRIAKENLVIDKIAAENGNMAIMMISGMSIFIADIKSEILEIAGDKDHIPLDLQNDLEQASQTAVKALNDYVALLKSNQENFKGSFRLGEKLYSLMLQKNERVDVSLSDILEAGEKNLERNLQEFNDAATQINENKTPIELIKEIKQNHPTAESLFEDTQNVLKDIRQFLIDSDFVTVPSDVIPKVIPTPKPFRQWAFAAMDTPDLVHWRKKLLTAIITLHPLMKIGLKRNRKIGYKHSIIQG